MLEFPLKHIRRRYKHSFVGVADMEVILGKESNQSYQPTTITVIDPYDKYKLIVKHLPASLGYYDIINNYKTYNYTEDDGTNHVIDGFIQLLIKLAKDNINTIINPQPMEKLTKYEKDQ